MVCKSGGGDRGRERGWEGGRRKGEEKDSLNMGIESRTCPFKPIERRVAGEGEGGQVVVHVIHCVIYAHAPSGLGVSLARRRHLK